AQHLMTFGEGSPRGAEDSGVDGPPQLDGEVVVVNVPGGVEQMPVEHRPLRGGQRVGRGDVRAVPELAGEFRGPYGVREQLEAVLCRKLTRGAEPRRDAGDQPVGEGTGGLRVEIPGAQVRRYGQRPVFFQPDVDLGRERHGRVPGTDRAGEARVGGGRAQRVPGGRGDLAEVVDHDVRGRLQAFFFQAPCFQAWGSQVAGPPVPGTAAGDGREAAPDAPFGQQE